MAYCPRIAHGYYIDGISCPDCKMEKKEKERVSLLPETLWDVPLRPFKLKVPTYVPLEERVTLLPERTYYTPPTLVDLGGPEGPGRGYAHNKAREIMGPSDAERLARMVDSRAMEHNMLGQITWVGPR